MPLKRQDRVGGSFAPPLTDELLSRYETLIYGTDAQTQIGEALRSVLNCVKHWWSLPESTGGRKIAHPSGKGVILPLDEPIATELFDSIPWTDDLNTFQKLFDEQLSGDIRHAAFHLLWHVKELDLDREPITSDKV